MGSAREDSTIFRGGASKHSKTAPNSQSNWMNIEQALTWPSSVWYSNQPSGMGALIFEDRDWGRPFWNPPDSQIPRLP